MGPRYLERRNEREISVSFWVVCPREHGWIGERNSLGTELVCRA